jgi:EAL domain-containing protein (putative c-di-GMP-specific phosphodiesterase class I)
LKDADLPGSALMVEVTETGVVSDPLLATITLELLRDHGVHAAIDDFGKGFSSLTQLKRLPIDALKIDSSFVRDVVIDRDDAAIVQAIIGLARNLDLQVIAEGVETSGQMGFLVNHGCSEAQGYLISRPLPADDFAARFLAAPQR